MRGRRFGGAVRGAVRVAPADLARYVEESEMGAGAPGDSGAAARIAQDVISRLQGSGGRGRAASGTGSPPEAAGA